MNVNTQYYFKGKWRERNEIYSMLDAPIVKVGKFKHYGTCDDGRKTLAIVKYGKEYKMLKIRKNNEVCIGTKLYKIGV